MKKGIVGFLVCSLLAATCLVPLSANADTITVKDDVLSNFTGKDGATYWGPYGDGNSYADGNLTLDTGATWMTMDLNTDAPYDANFSYQYVVIRMKLSSGTQATDNSLTIGQTDKGERNGKLFSDWTLQDGTTGINLTNDFQDFTIDLKASGTAAIAVDPAIAINKTADDNEAITIQSITYKGGTYEGTDSGSSSSQGDPSTPSKISSGTYVVGDKWSAANGGDPREENYWGPYGDMDMKDGALNFYADDTTSYLSMGFFYDTFDIKNGYKYFVIVAKCDDPSLASDVQVSIGTNSKGKQHGQALSDWTLANGKKGAKLTTSYQTICVDLAKSGTTAFLTDSKIPDFALNPGKNTGYTVTIDKMYLTDTVPTAAITGGAASSKGSTKATSSSKTASTSAGNPNTGNAATAGIVLTVFLAAGAGTVLLKRGRKKLQR